MSWMSCWVRRKCVTATLQISSYHRITINSGMPKKLQWSTLLISWRILHCYYIHSTSLFSSLLTMYNIKYVHAKYHYTYIHTFHWPINENNCIQRAGRCANIVCIPPAWDQFPDMNWYIHDDVMKWKHFPRYWPFVWGIHRSPANSPHKGQSRVELWCFLCSVPE